MGNMANSNVVKFKFDDIELSMDNEKNGFVAFEIRTGTAQIRLGNIELNFVGLDSEFGVSVVKDTDEEG